MSIPLSTNLELGLNDASALAQPIIDIRYGQVGLVQVRLHTTDRGAIIDELSGRVATTPHFFRRTGVCLDLSALEKLPAAADLRGVIDAVRRVGMLSIGLVGASAEMEALAIAVELPVLSSFRTSTRSAAVQAAAAPTIQLAPPIVEPEPEPEFESESAVESEAPAPRALVATGVPALMHTQPVRSGQRIYARHRDLIVTATVAAGAEVMADGCLHVYGSLRGRAMAGAHGDLSARVFCQEFHAELVSIAGVFRVFETIPADLVGKPVQVWLAGEKLHCERIGA